MSEVDEDVLRIKFLPALQDKAATMLLLSRQNAPHHVDYSQVFLPQQLLK